MAERVLCCGDRNWTDKAKIRLALEQLPPGTVIIHGDARGADRLSGEVAEELGFEVVKFPAQWARYGRGAGPIRNQQMLDEGKPTMVLAFHSNIEESKGTRDMITRANRAGLLGVLIDDEWEPPGRQASPIC